MAADLHIHALVGVTEQNIADFQANTLGTPHFNLARALSLQQSGRLDELHDRIAETPDVWIGEVSWLKASMIGPEEEFVPDTVAKVAEAIGYEFPVLDEELMERILAAFDVPNQTLYGLAKRDQVAEWLDAHMGEKLFTVSW